MKVKNYRSPVRLAGVALAALAASLSAQADYQSVVQSQGPVGYWRLSETVQPPASLTANNIGSLGANANGTYNAFTTRGLPGPFTGSVAIGLDGSAQNVSTPNATGLNNNNFTFEIWAKPAQVPKFAYLASSAVIASPRSGWYFAQDDGSTFGAGSAWVVRFFNQNGTTPTVQLAVPITKPANTWYHLVLTYDGTTAALYSDGALVTNRAAAYVPNAGAAFTVGCRSDGAWFWPGQAAETAMYGSALSAARVAAHYNAATTAPGTYASTVQADAPLLYHRYTEAVDPPAANLGTLGAAGNGLYAYPVQAGVAGPINPPYPGFDAANKAAGFTGAGGAVRLPALNLNTNTVTMTAWVKANGAQAAGTGLVLCNSGATTAGLTMDRVYGGLGLGYVWDNNDYGISWQGDFFLPPLPDNDWAYVALVVQPSQAAIFVCDAANYVNFTGRTNMTDINHTVNHAAEPFDGITLVGADGASTTKYFNGSIDEVAIFNRALKTGELYTQYATAVGSVPPLLFGAMEGPSAAVKAGDPLVLTVDVGGTAPMTYSWRKGGTEVATTTSGTFVIPSANMSDAGSWTVAVSNPYGNVASGPVSVTISLPDPPVLVKLDGFKSRTLYPTGSLIMSATVTGGALRYQWYKDSQPIATGTTSAYIVPSVTGTDAGSYSVTVTNAAGSVSSPAPAVITVPTPGAGSYEALMVASAPQAWWRLDEPAGSLDLFDAMGRHDGYYTNLNGTVPPVILGAAGAISGSSSTSASFDPNYKGVGVVPYSPDINANIFTLEAWVKTPVTTSGLVPLSTTYDGKGVLWQTTGGYWNGNGANIQDYGATTAGIVVNNWTHLVMEYDPISNADFPYRYYINGQGDGGYIWSGPALNIAGPLIIGGHGVMDTLVDTFFNGQVDEVAVYKRRVPVPEIQSHFDGRFGNTTVPYFIGSFIPQTVATGKTINYSTVVQGSSPITLQWYKGNTPIPGATTSSLTIGPTVLGDTGTYTLWATNIAGVSSQSVAVNVIQAVGYANVTNDLVLHMRFDGDTTDSSGHSNNGTPMGSAAVAYVSGIVGAQALQYETLTNGLTPVAIDSTSYVDLGKPTDLQFGASTSFSFSMWVKLPTGSLQGDLPFIGISTNSMNNPGWAFGPSYENGGWQWCLNDGVNNVDVNGPNNSINDGAWHHFLVSVDRTAKMVNTYLDGVCVNQRDIASLGSVDNNNYWPVTIGQDPTGNYLEDGSAILDDLGVWRRALTSAEAVQIESAGRTANRSFDTVNPNPDVKITVTRSGSSVTLAWSQGVLEQSDTLGATASWSNVAGASAPSYTFTPATTGSKFFRVKVQ